MAQVAPLAFILGEPLGHSLSPLLHGHWLKKYGLAGHYVPWQLPQQALQSTLAAWRNSQNIMGGNVTLPHKKAVVPYLDALTPLAQRCGAVNTIIRQANGQWLGHNTDGLGLVADIAQPLQGQNILLLGAGGAAAGLLPALYDAGAHVSIYNRTTATAHELAQQAALYNNTVQVLTQQPTPQQYNIIINTITQSQVACQFLPALCAGGLVYDINYGQTPLLQAAAAQNFATRDGLGMLLQQAVAGFAAWFGHTPHVGAEEETLLRQALRAR